MNNVLPIAAAGAGLLGYAIGHGVLSIGLEVVGIGLALLSVGQFVTGFADQSIWYGAARRRRRRGRSRS